MYYLVYCKNFGLYIFDAAEYEFIIYKSSDKESCINKAREFNDKALLNINTEHFKVYESETKTYNKKKSKLIYPTKEYPLFH